VINSSIIIKNGTLKTIFGFQQNNRKEYSDVVSGNYGLYLQLNTFNYEMKYLFPEMNNYNLEIGVNGMYQVSMNKGTEFLVPAYHLFDAGVFGIIRKNIKSIDITAGLRYDRRNQDASALFLDEDGKSVNGNIPGSLQKFKKFDRTFEGFSGSAGLSWQISELVYSKLNFAAGYRSPNIAELGANGIHEGTFRFEKGNSNLAPEKSIQGDLGIGMNTSHVTAELDLFDNRIRNYIYLAAMQSISGGDSTEDGATVFNYDSGDAEFHGGEFLIDIHPHPLDWLHFENSISFVRAIQNNRPDSMKYLPNTPATRLNTEIRIGGKKILQVFSNPYFRLGITTWLRQDNIFSAYGTETSTPGYTVMNAGIGADLFLKKKEHFTINFSVNNIADVAYQNHLSRLKYAPENPVTGKTGVFNEGRSFNMKFGFYF
jgi:iron complex outermembrane receptor protein